jgi:CTP synthase
VQVKYIHSESINAENVAEKLKDLDGVLVAPGFGSRGIDGKVEAIRFVRENNIPFFGICLGMQCAVVEYGRNVLGLENAQSTEMDEFTANPVISMMEEQKKIVNKGGTMRLGSYPCDLKKGSKAAAIYGRNHISERHRHRYEFNNKFLEQYEKSGMMATGINPQSNLVEIVELKNHPFFIGAQFHPELKSTVDNPHPLFVNFVAASLSHSKRK